MHPLLNEFKTLLDTADKAACVELILAKLNSKDIDIITLYTQVLSPALNEPFCKDSQRSVCIWEEHTRSSIIRTIIECCYPYVIRERNKIFGSNTRGKVIVVCPTEEYHELGARMIADFFALASFDVTFIGANTPQDDIWESIGYVKGVLSLLK